LSNSSFHVPGDDDRVEPRVVVVPVSAVTAGAEMPEGAVVMMVDCQRFEGVASLPAVSW
jgi:hypothetical protein